LSTNAKNTLLLFILIAPPAHAAKIAFAWEIGGVMIEAREVACNEHTECKLRSDLFLRYDKSAYSFDVRSSYFLFGNATDHSLVPANGKIHSLGLYLGLRQRGLEWIRNERKGTLTIKQIDFRKHIREQFL
jgi:hypothetical protein